LKSAALQYANAFADVAISQGAPQTATKQLLSFGELYTESAELRNFLASPAVTHETKHTVIEKLVARIGASRTIRNFIFVIIDHRRSHMLPEILAATEEVVRQRQGIADAEVSSAVELSEAQKTELAMTLGRLTGKRVEPKFSVDPTLLGGAVARVGDTIYDGSLRSRLSEMRTRLAEE
jgi:F-type H+-transporting ATPase subunit delta